MRIRLRHVVHSTVVLAVLVQLGFAAAFLADVHQSDRSYAALAAHHVRVPARVLGCGRYLTSTRPSIYQDDCLVTYSFGGRRYSDLIPYSQPKAFYVDPLDPSDRMSVGYFAGGPTAHTGDIVFATLLIAGAVLVTTAHQLHLRQRRRTRRGLDPDPPQREDL